MLWLNPHRRFQGQLSAYVDGELAIGEAAKLESHIESCDSCAEELAELRMLAAAMGELPQVDVPRSFALTPAAIAPRAAPSGWAPLNNGLRLAAGGLAAALAVMVVLDAGGIVGDGGGAQREDADSIAAARAGTLEPFAESAGAAQEDAATDSRSAQGYVTTPSPTPAVGAGVAGPSSGEGQAGGSTPGQEAEPTPRAEGTPVPTEQPAGEAQGGVNSPEPSPFEPIREPAAIETVPPPTLSDDISAQLGLNGSEEEDTETLDEFDSGVDSDDGLSALTVTEIVLAALLGASIVGIAAATYAERRRR